MLPKITLLPTIRKQLRDSIVIASQLPEAVKRSTYTVRYSTVQTNWSKIGSSKIIMFAMKTATTWLQLLLCLCFLVSIYASSSSMKNSEDKEQEDDIYNVRANDADSAQSRAMATLNVTTTRPQHRRTLALLVDGIFHPRIIANPRTCAWHF